MGIFRKLGLAKRVVDQHGDKIAKGVEKATDVVNDKTQGKYADQLEKVDEVARKLDKTQHDDDAPTPPTEDEPRA